MLGVGGGGPVVRRQGWWRFSGAVLPTAAEIRAGEWIRGGMRLDPARPKPLDESAPVF